MGEFEEKYNNQLRSMELALVQVYREDESLVDWQVLTAVNNLIRTYTAEQRSRQAPTMIMHPTIQQTYSNLHSTCEGWLKHGPLHDETGQTIQIDNALTIAEIIACLKRIRRSIQMWQKEGGRRGYFKFIDQFLPE